LRLSSLPLLFSNALDKARLDRQLCCAESEGFPCHIFRDTVKLKHHATWCHTARPVVNRTLTFTHTDFGRLRSYRQVREDADPHATGTLHVTGDRAASRFDLTCSDAFRLNGLQTECTE